MARGRPRKVDASIPAHIDQAKIPKGAYWDSRDRVWYTLVTPIDGKAKRRKLASADAKLSQLHALLEDIGGAKSGTLGWLCDLFNGSSQFKALAEKTRADYEAQRKLVANYRTKAGLLLEDLKIGGITSPYLQRLVDKIGETHPSKANHLIRYLSRVFGWGVPRGRCASNPAKGIEKAKERKLRRLPSRHTHMAILEYARANHEDYLWVFMELAYLLRLRGIEVLTLSDAHEAPDGIQTNRRKGSRDTLVLWSPRLRAAWEAGKARRRRVWEARRRISPIKPEDRMILVNAKGAPISKRALDQLWQNMMAKAIAAGAIAQGDRFGPHDLKRKGITDTTGTRHDKREASGHRTESMMDVYDLSVPEVTTPGGV